MTIRQLERKDGGEDLQHFNIGFEIKQIDDADPDFFIFEGLASTFGNIDSHEDIILPGAFAKSLLERTPVILWQHDTWEPIGMPIEVRETQEGLFLKGKLPRTDDLVKGRVIPQMRVGSIKSMSIGFRTVESEFNTETNVRILKEVKLFEISLVTFPANSLATIQDFKSNKQTAFNIEQVKEFTPRELEKALRESGFSKDASVYLVGKFAKQGEPEGDNALIESLKSTVDILQTHSFKQATRKLNAMIS